MGIPAALAEFDGYGGHGRVIFVGVEEKNAGDDLDNLTIRERFPPRVDLKRACDELFGGDWWGTGPQLRQPVWCTASKIVHALGDGRHWTTIRDEVIGRAGSDTLLSELLPVPLDKSGVWQDVHRQRYGFADHSSYIEDVLGSEDRSGPRLKFLKRLIETESPDYVFCYGKGMAEWFKRLFPADVIWRPETSSPTGYLAQPFSCARWGAMRIAITRHYSAKKTHKSRPFEEVDIAPLLRALSRPDAAAVKAKPPTRRRPGPTASS
jgi:hypothetical protein